MIVAAPKWHAARNVRRTEVRLENPDELTLQASQVRLLELRHLERCERGLAAAYRAAHGLPGIPDSQLSQLERKHLEHAALLRERILALGGTTDKDDEDVWVTGHDARALRYGEQRSISTYHDHLLDMDRATVEAVREFILPEHADALAMLDPHYEHDRDGDL
jgi:hypothetical protein